MKPLPLLLIFLLALTGIARADDGKAVQAQVRAFYSWYVHTLNSNPAEVPGASPMARRYVSARLLKDIARRSKSDYGLEADPFLCGQDWDPEWEKNIRIKDMDPEGSKWSVQVELTGKQIASHRLNLVLVRENKKWKIDKVSDGDTH